MLRVDKRSVVLYGLAFMLIFMSVTMLLFASIRQLDFGGEEGFAERGPVYWRDVGTVLEAGLIRTALPAWILSLSIPDKAYGVLYYYPLLGGLVWFVYGCLIAWGRETHRLKIALLSVCVIWILFSLIAQIAKIPVRY